MKALRKYLVPVRMTKLSSSVNKASIDSGWTEDGWVAWKRGEKPIPAPGASVFEIDALSHAEAYRKLCAAVRPNDPRPIMSKKNIGIFIRCG